MKSRLLYFLFLLSGATSLVYELVWTRQLILLFGSTVLGIATIVSCFLGGLAWGASYFGKRADSNSNPLLTYAKLEAFIGFYAMLLPLLISFSDVLVRGLWSVSGGRYELFSLFRFVYAGILLLPPTFCMGGTLPLLSAFAARQKSAVAAEIGILYGLNTLGAVIGTLGAGFFLMPQWGILTSVFICAFCNLLVAFMAWRMSKAERMSPSNLSEGFLNVPWTGSQRLILFITFLSGFAALTLEICWSRVFATFYGSSLHGFCITLAAFLIGIGFGSLGVSGRLERKPATLYLYGIVELGIALGAACAFIFFHELSYWNFLLQAQFHDNPQLWVLVRYTMTSLALVVPTVLMGMSFPVAISVIAPNQPGRAAGKVYSWNTWGGILGSFLTGFVLLPVLGLEKTMLLAICLLAVLATVLFFSGFKKAQPLSTAARIAALVLALGLGLVLFQRPPWNPAILSAGGVYFRHWFKIPRDRESFFEQFTTGERAKTPLYYQDGRNASVGVYQDSKHVTFLEVNGKVDASDDPGDMITQSLIGILPMLTQSDPKEALLIGCGSGTSLGALALHDSLTKIEMVELEKGVVEGAKYFEKANHNPFSDPRVHWLENDGRNHLALNKTQYDLIISQPSNPWMSGAANLFTREYFSLARSRLRDGGIFCQWIQLYAISPENLKVLLRTLQSEFPHFLVFQTNDVDLILICRKGEPPKIDLAKLDALVENSKFNDDLRRIYMKSPPNDNRSWGGRILSLYRMDSERAKFFAESAPLNTDDNLHIESATAWSLFEETREQNREAIEAIPSPFASHLRFEESRQVAITHALNLARELFVLGKKRYAREVYREALKRVIEEKRDPKLVREWVDQSENTLAGMLEREFHLLDEVGGK